MVWTQTIDVMLSFLRSSNSIVHSGYIFQLVFQAQLNIRTCKSKFRMLISKRIKRCRPNSIHVICMYSIVFNLKHEIAYRKQIASISSLKSLCNWQYQSKLEMKLKCVCVCACFCDIFSNVNKLGRSIRDAHHFKLLLKLSRSH